MHIWRNRSLRTLFALAFVVALVLVSEPKPAAADQTIGVWVTDHFDANPGARWWFQHNAYSGGGGFGTHGYFDYYSAWLESFIGWSAVGRSVTLPLAGPLSSWECTAHVHFYPYMSGYTTVNLEVIDPDTWTYIALKTVSGAQYKWQFVATDSFIPPRKDVIARVALVTDGPYRTVDVDEFSIQCL